jgi:type I restriction enzyme S subunit
MGKQLPKNWLETELETIFNLVYGKGLSVKELTEEGYDVYGANGIIGKFTNYSFENSKVIISCRGAASGAIHKTNPKSFITSNSIVLNEISSDLIHLDFIKYVMTNTDKSDVITGTAQPQITIQLLKNLQIPLPPLAEQNRIVAKLDALFAQLETIKASLAKVPLLLKDFRQQVLTQAVTGKLTEEWRKGKELEEWNKEKLSNIADIIDPHPSHRTPPEVENGIPYISIGDIDKSSKIDFFNSRKVSPTILDEHLKRYQLKDGDFIFGKIGTIGKPIIIPYVQDYTLSANVILIQPKKEIVHPKFIFFYMDSTVLMKLIMADTKSTSQPAYGIKKMREQIIPFPIIEEQQEIVSRVESLFAKADAIEKQYETLKAKIDSLPQAILHKAFKGELTEQLDTDGDARELLQQIQELKNGTVKPKKATSKKVKKYPGNETVLRMVAEPK